jgi:serine/threonine protein kinase
MGATSSHPNDHVLQSYGLGKLDDASARLVGDHLESCSECQRRVSELSSDEFLGRLQEARIMREKAISGWAPSAASSTDGAPATVRQSPSVDTLPPGLKHHPDYEIVRELGRGGMGVVYLANNRIMRRPEVLKVVGKHLLERPGVCDRFLREIRSAAMLHHANVVSAYSAMRFDESLVLAMEYVEGLDLAKMVKTKGPLPIAHSCNFVHQAALGLQHAHEHKMVHRDVKPANLILARAGTKAIVKVLDFGLAKGTSEGERDSNLTRDGQMLGTPDYIAPEQIRDAQSADIRADIYSLGCTLYYLLTGGPPFRGAHLWDVYQAHFSMDAGPLNLVRPEVPVELAAVVAKMMAKEPGRRFQTPAEVARALMPFFSRGAAGTLAPRAEVSKVSTQAAQANPVETISAPTQPAMSMAPATALHAKTSAQPNRTDPKWDSLLEFQETDSLGEPAPHVVAKPNTAKPAWFWPSIAAGVLILTVVVMWVAVVLNGKTRDRNLASKQLRDDATLELDRKKAVQPKSPNEPDTLSSSTPSESKATSYPIEETESTDTTEQAKALGQAERPVVGRDGKIGIRELAQHSPAGNLEALHTTETAEISRGNPVGGGSSAGKNQAPRNGAKNKVTDAFQPGTIWAGKHFVHTQGTAKPHESPVTLTVRAREGGKFKALYVFESTIREITGTIEDGRIGWFARDVKIVKGGSGFDHIGTINGGQIKLIFSGISHANGKRMWGTVLMKLTK